MHADTVLARQESRRINAFILEDSGSTRCWLSTNSNDASAPLYESVLRSSYISNTYIYIYKTIMLNSVINARI
jgi:hypothetical protein